jgi:uncharacterized surface protein with fasciclin (FAS1) repeats/ABC-type Fe3+-citrate transport system substrate-binding protein
MALSKIFTPIIIFSFVSMFLLMACESEPEESAQTVVEEVVVEEPAQTVVDIAVADGRFTTLVTALGAADLVGVLSGEGPFTVFAPTDDAFNNLPEGTLDSLLADIPALTDVLLYHVVSGKVMAADVVGLDSAETVQGSSVGISVMGESVMVDDANVIITDIEGSNGVIHVIDAVIIPAAEVVTPKMIEIIDALGKPMFFDTVPTAIAAISPSATELLYAAGGKSILRDRASLYPEEVLNLPDIGSSYEPSIEGILESNPDLVIIEALTQARFIKSLSAANLNVMAVKAENLDDIKTNIRNIGTVLGTSDIAEKSIADMEARLIDAKTSEAGSVLFLISDREQNLYAATSKSYTGLIGSLAGLTNAADGLDESGPYPGFALMATESILIANPDFIVTITPAPEPAPRLSQSITKIPPFAGLNAIRNNAILEGDKDIFLQSPGPRIVDAVEALANHVAGIK